jgi:hypothetical protein
MALDQEINAVKAKLERDNAGATSAELDGLNAAKKRLLGFIETVSPEYKKARETYSKLSKPVEQLQTISNIADKATRDKDSSILLNRFSNELEKAKKENIDTAIQSEYEQLLAALQRSEATMIDKNQKEIKNLMLDEIIKRYQYKEGLYQYYIKNNIEIKKAIDVLNNKEEYNKILKI